MTKRSKVKRIRIQIIERYSLLVVLLVVMLFIFGLMLLAMDMQKYSASTKVKDALMDIYSDMAGYKESGNGYPMTIDISDVVGVDEVIIKGGGSQSGDKFCVSAYSVYDDEIQYYVSSDSDNNKPKNGSCRDIGYNVAPSGLSIAYYDDKNNVKLNWDKTENANGYIVEYSQEGDFSKAEKTEAIANETILSNIDMSKTLFFRVCSVVAGQMSEWSNTLVVES